MPRAAAPDATPARLTLPPLAWVGLTLFALVMVGSLLTQIVLLEDQRTTVDRQLAVAAKQLDELQPLLRDVQPLVEDTREALPAARRLTRETLPLVEAAQPLVTELDRARAPEQLQAAGAMARAFLAADAPEALSRVAPLATDVARLTDELLTEQRLRRVLVRSAATFGEVRALHTVPKITEAAELAPEQLRTLKESLAVQRETLALVREGVIGVNELRQLARETLTQTRRAANSAENLDRKLGGSLPVRGSG